MTQVNRTLEGRRVLVVGGASGIGFAVAERASELGATVIIASRNEAKVTAAAARLARATGHALDLRDETRIGAFFRDLGAFDHMAITAGDWDIPIFVPLSDIEIDAAKDAFEVRLWGALAAAKHAMKVISPNGSMVFTGGMLTYRPVKGGPLATVGGAAVEALARGLAIELAPIRVNAVSPGLILTEHALQTPADRIDARVSKLPISRGGTPSEAASAYIYLMQNSYITGQVLPVDGGGLLV